MEKEYISSVSKNSLGYKTLVEFDNNGFLYCLWKSIDRFNDSCGGDTDFDILVDPSDKKELLKYLDNNGWVQLNAESWRSFPEVFDFVKYDSGFKSLIHFHIHFQIIAGDKLLKSLQLPFEKLYLDTRISESGIFYSKPELEFIVFILRVAKKFTDLHYLSVVKRREWKALFRNYRSEWEFIKERCNIDELRNTLARDEFKFLSKEIVEIVFNDLEHFTRKRRSVIRDNIKKFDRFDFITGCIEKIRRMHAFKVEGSGKLMTSGGKAIAVCGPDGSGKTTLCNLLQSRLTKHIKVSRQYLGGSPTSKGTPRTLSRIFILPFVSVFKHLIRLFDADKAERLKQYYYDFEESLIIDEKLKRYKKGLKAKSEGQLVLFERFPIFPGFGDGPPPSADQKLISKYQPFELPDMLFVLNLNPQVAIERKPDHSAEIIRSKVSAFNSYIDQNVDNIKIHALNAEEDLDLLVQQIVEAIFEEAQQQSVSKPGRDHAQSLTQ